MCGPYRYVHAQRVWFSAFLVINRVWFLRSILEFGMFLRGYYFIIINKTVNKRQFNIGLN